MALPNITSVITKKATSHEIKASSRYLEIVGFQENSEFTITVETANNSKVYGRANEVTVVPVLKG